MVSLLGRVCCKNRYLYSWYINGGIIWKWKIQFFITMVINEGKYPFYIFIGNEKLLEHFRLEIMK